MSNRKKKPRMKINTAAGARTFRGAVPSRQPGVPMEQFNSPKGQLTFNKAT